MPNIPNRIAQYTKKSAFLTGPRVRAAMTRIRYPDTAESTDARPTTVAPRALMVGWLATGSLIFRRTSGDREECSWSATP
jgi:hypothetical protein